MKVKGLTTLVFAFTFFLIATSAAFAKPADRDSDGIRDRHERYLGTSVTKYTKPSRYVNRVVRYAHSNGKLIFYRAKGRPVYALVDQESVIFCNNESYWLGDDDFDDDSELDDDLGDDQGGELDGDPDSEVFEDETGESAPCSDGAIGSGIQIEEAKLSYFNGRFFIDTIYLR